MRILHFIQIVRTNVAFAYISVNLINFQRHYGGKDGVTEEGFDILHKIYCAWMVAICQQANIHK